VADLGQEARLGVGGRLGRGDVGLGVLVVAAQGQRTQWRQGQQQQVEGQRSIEGNAEGCAVHAAQTQQ